MTKVFIGTLYSGEAELGDCISSINFQTFKNITHEIFKFLPNKEAHERLYSRFMEQQKFYDYFIKLDADMVFRDPMAVEKIVKFFESNAGLDHLILSVHDFYTDASIIGIHIFSNRCEWGKNMDSIFVDHNPVINGQRLFFLSQKPEANMIAHAFCQSDRDAVSFGIHKLSKIIQKDVHPYNYPQLLNHWGNINLLIKKYKKTKDKKCHLAIVAIYACIRKAISDGHHLKQDNYKKEEIKYLENPIYIGLFIHSILYRKVLLIRCLGATRVLNMITFKFVMRLKKVMGKDNSIGNAPSSLQFDE